MKRRWSGAARVLLGVLVVALLALGLLGGRWLSDDPEVVAPRIFEFPGTVCDRFREGSFEEQVDDVASTADRSLRERVAVVRAEVTRGFIGRPATPERLRAPLGRLADDLDAAATTDDFSRAKAEAVALDQELGVMCR